MTFMIGRDYAELQILKKSENGPCQFVHLSVNKNKKWVPLRAMKTFIRKKMGHTT